MRKPLWLLAIYSLVIILCSISLYAQERKAVTGTVLSDDGSPLPGVTVRIKGSNRNTQTDARGSYRIPVQPGESLEDRA